MKLSEAIAALERGEEVEYLLPATKEWCKFEFDTIDSWKIRELREFKFRLKPKPKEVWLNIYSKASFTHDTEEEARKANFIYGYKYGPGARVAVKFREVVE